MRSTPTLRLSSALSLLLGALLLAACSGGDLLSAYLETHRAALEQPAATEKRPTRFVVAPGAPARSIAANLKAAGLITDDQLFEAYVRVNGLANQLQAGTFTLSPDMTIPQIAEALQNARAPEIIVRIGEGWRLEQTADYLDMNTSLDGVEYKRRGASGNLTGLDPNAYPFLSQRPEGASLEGFLYPDTYRLPAEDASVLDLLRRQLDQFKLVVMPMWERSQAEGRTNLKTNLSLHQALTLASIVEREAVVDDERPMIARVYLNRLGRNMQLQADPTVQYAMGYQPATGRWWKSPMFLEEYDKVDSPYNTYKVTGLPPGPICSPSLESIRAVLEPAEHSYLYFVALPDGSGRHAFSTTFEEHLENVRKYQHGQ
jgi:UPF0755 protein